MYVVTLLGAGVIDTLDGKYHSSEIEDDLALAKLRNGNNYIRGRKLDFKALFCRTTLKYMIYGSKFVTTYPNSLV